MYLAFNFGTRAKRGVSILARTGKIQSIKFKGANKAKKEIWKRTARQLQQFWKGSMTRASEERFHLQGT